MKSRAGHKLDQYGKCRACHRSRSDLHADCPGYKTAADYTDLSKHPTVTKKGRKK